MTARDVITSGCILLKDVGTAIEIVEAYTTNYGSILYEEPSVVLIDDEIARDLRTTLKPFIGKKSLKSLEGDMAERISTLFNSKITDETIEKFDGLSVEIDSLDTRRAFVSVSYKPVFGLKWILATLNVQST